MNELHYTGVTADTIQTATAYAQYLHGTERSVIDALKNIMQVGSSRPSRIAAEIACARVGVPSTLVELISIAVRSNAVCTQKWADPDNIKVAFFKETPPTNLEMTQELYAYDGVPMAALFTADDNRHYFMMMVGEETEYDNIKHTPRGDCFTAVLCRINADSAFMAKSRAERDEETTTATYKRLMTQQNEAWLFDWYEWANKVEPRFQRTWMKASWLPQDSMTVETLVAQRA